MVTGGASGIGWEISRFLADRGFSVVAADIHPGHTTDGPRGIHYSPLDVTDHEAVHEFFDDLVDQRGTLDVLINNAGVQRHRWLEELTWGEWSQVIDVNLHGVFSCLQAGGRHMLARGKGAIVNIASVSARGSAGRAPYSTSKAAVIGLTATAGAEWAGRGVRVNAVAPGYIRTGVFEQGVAAGTLDPEIILNRIPAQRLATADEIASVVGFLISDAASYMNGQTLYVDGGFMVDYGVPLSMPRSQESPV